MGGLYEVMEWGKNEGVVKDDNVISEDENKDKSHIKTQSLSN